MPRSTRASLSDGSLTRSLSRTARPWHGYPLWPSSRAKLVVSGASAARPHVGVPHAEHPRSKIKKPEKTVFTTPITSPSLSSIVLKY